MPETTAKLGKVSAKMIDAEVKELRQAVKIPCLHRSSVDSDSSDEVGGSRNSITNSPQIQKLNLRPVSICLAGAAPVGCPKKGEVITPMNWIGL